MKSICRKLTAGLMAAVFLLSVLGVPADASEALGHDLAGSELLLSAGTTYGSGAFWSDSRADLRQEHYVVYAPNEHVRPFVACGDTTRELTTVLSAAQALEARGLRVVAGINGDYYGVQHGIPLGSTMSDGILRNCNGDPYYAVGFRADGTALIGDPKLAISASANGGESFPVYAFNHIRQSGYGIFLYDSRFNERGTTGTSEPGVDVLCTPVEGALSIGGALTLRVEEVLPEAVDSAVPANGYILTTNHKAGDRYTAALLALQSGDELVVRVVSESGEPGWNEVVNMIGAPELLIENGEVRGGLPLGSAPRTAIGMRADGTLIFYTVDGRMAGCSIGATLSAVAMRLAELGCDAAVALDGGGSTTLVATMPDEWSARVVNTPSEGGERAVSNQVLLVADAAPSGVPDHIYLHAEPTALPGAKLSLRAAVVDSNYIPFDPLLTGVQPVLSSDAGSVEGGVLTLPSEPGSVSVFASCGALSSSASVQVVEPDSVVVRCGGDSVSSLFLGPNEELALSAQGYRNHLPVPGDSSCFFWTFEGRGAELSSEGRVLRSGTDAGAGTLTVSIGGKSVSLPVTVSVRSLRLLENYESAFEPIVSQTEESEGSSSRLALSRAADPARVRFGRASGRLDYSLAAGIEAQLPVSCSVDPSHSCVELWVLGDGSGVRLALETDAGVSSGAALDFSGWERVLFTLPPDARRITALVLGAEQDAGGTLWLDQMTSSREPLTDETVPDVSLSVDEELGIVTGCAFDTANGAALPTVRLMLDGAPLAFRRSEHTGALSAQLPPSDGLAHHLVLTAGDAGGNLARASVLIPASPDMEPAFPDAAGHWAAGAIEYLKRVGVSNGSDGMYKPDDHISRQEFAVMLFRYLSPDGVPADTPLPFADSDGIAPWAVDAARVMYALGVIGGAKDLNGALCFNPHADITRQEAATMLGRLLEKGYAASEIPFADSADVPDWAREHVAVLASLGVFDDFVSDVFSPAQPLTRAQMAAMLLRLQ
ncbi:MAG: phosphodiester glycosidase family protein [Oscillospiraceae bacterium]|nr:phosphodiester glycosidase family protein [Oscillospiraceae bacterium]